MIQELFRIGPIVISPFGVMLVLAFFSGYLQLKRGMKRLGVGDEEDASSILFAAGVGGILGAKIYYAILYGDCPCCSGSWPVCMVSSGAARRVARRGLASPWPRARRSRRSGRSTPWRGSGSSSPPAEGPSRSRRSS